MTEWFQEFTAVMQFLALKDQCQNLASRGYSTGFALHQMKIFEEMLERELSFPELKDLITSGRELQ